MSCCHWGEERETLPPLCALMVLIPQDIQDFLLFCVFCLLTNYSRVKLLSSCPFSILEIGIFQYQLLWRFGLNSILSPYIIILVVTRRGKITPSLCQNDNQRLCFVSLSQIKSLLVRTGVFGASAGSRTLFCLLPSPVPNLPVPVHWILPVSMFHLLLLSWMPPGHAVMERAASGLWGL